jgi:DNA-binding NtrC family response regulator
MKDNRHAAPTPRLALAEAGLRALIADADRAVRAAFEDFFRHEGLRPMSASTASEARAALEQPGAPVAVAFIDLGLAGGGSELVAWVKRHSPETAVIATTEYGGVESAVEAMRHGACDYLCKPLLEAELAQSLERGLEQHRMLREHTGLREAVNRRVSVEGLVAADARMTRIIGMVRAVAASKTTVLMNGESGTGKSLIARAVHEASPRASGPFVELSCGSIPETLLESELFGHVKGAFTGAHADKHGRFHAARGGTIFLDEINSASPAMQLKLLRVLQEKRFEPVGSTQSVESDARVILASNQPLEQLVAAGTFRQDLFYRINVVTIDLPPLRERPADIRPLAERFLAKHAIDLGRPGLALSEGSLALLTRYAFPGNVRELQNIMERAAVLCAQDTIEPTDLPAHLQDAGPSGATLNVEIDAPTGNDAWVPMHLDEALREPERRILLRALKANGWNRVKTAEQLGINRTTLYKRLKALGIDAPEAERRDQEPKQ